MPPATDAVAVAAIYNTLFQTEVMGNRALFAFYGGFMSTGIYAAVKEKITTRQAAEHYGYRVNRYGMMCCPFHADQNPSMKVDQNFICFGCQEKGVDSFEKLKDLLNREWAFYIDDEEYWRIS